MSSGFFYRDSLGRNAPSPAVFLGAAKELYADKLLFADGFDGIWFLPEYSQDRTAKLEAGSLVLAGDDSITLDDLVLPPNTSSIDLLWNSSQSGSVRFQFSSSGQDSEIVVDYTNRRMIVAGKPAALPSGQTTVGKITLALRNNKLVLLSGRNEYPLLVTGPDGITLKISNPGEETFYLDDIVILKETEAIIRNSENSLEKSPELI